MLIFSFVLGANSPWISCISVHLATRDTDSLCSGLSFQGCFSELPWKVEIDSISLLSRGSFFFSPIMYNNNDVPPPPTKVTQVCLQTNYKRFGFPKLGASQLGCKTQCLMKHPAGSSFAWSPWYWGAGQEDSMQTWISSCLLCCGCEFLRLWPRNLRSSACRATCGRLTCELAKRINLRPLQFLTIWQLGRVRLCDGPSPRSGGKQQNWAWGRARLPFPLPAAKLPMARLLMAGVSLGLPHKFITVSHRSSVDLILGLVVLKLGEPQNILGSSLIMQTYK